MEWTDETPHPPEKHTAESDGAQLVIQGSDADGWGWAVYGPDRKYKLCGQAKTLDDAKNAAEDALTAKEGK